MSMLIDVSRPGENPTYIKGPDGHVPIDIEIIRKKDGRERILLNNFDISKITMKYEIHSQPCDLKELIIYIPIGHITM
jgi:hypothetical protein